MSAGPVLFLYHLALLALPLAALALLRFRLVPAVLVLAALHHHPMEPMPGMAEAAPICCVLAQSVEAGPPQEPPVVRRTMRLPLLPPPLVPAAVRPAGPAIRAPPSAAVHAPPAPWAPASRAA